VQRHLTGALLHGVFADTGARAIITTTRHAAAVRDALGSGFADALRLCIGGAPGFHDYSGTLAGQPAHQLPDEVLGSRMMFSSGTTGRPKGIRHPRLDVHPADAPLHLGRFTDLLGFAADTVYLSPAPTYHTSPFRSVIAVQQVGGTVVCQEYFDPEAALSAIERYRVTHAQFVPTMLTRMLQLPSAVRSRYDTSSLQVAITGAAPCPPDLKRRIMAWWGPVLHELYGASESYGNCHIGPQDALARPGSVGRALAGQIHILSVDSPDSADLPVGEVGQIWFAGTPKFSYLGDTEKNQAARNARGWSTVGDLGRLDAEGFLYVVWRRDHVIISGGVNVHPQLVEDRLAEHHAVADVAVVGIADADLGQRVHAIVVAAVRAAEGDEFAEQLLAFAAQGVPGPMRPRSVEFVAGLPRGENGKLYKRQLSPKSDN
jgi:long-chain acyl-CoA synthetase